MWGSVTYRVNGEHTNSFVLSNILIGGERRTPMFALADLFPKINLIHKSLHPMSRVKFIRHKYINVADILYKDSVNHIYCRCPLNIFVSKLVIADVKTIVKIHDIHVLCKLHINNILDLVDNNSYCS